jgi:WD40 repeat protein
MSVASVMTEVQIASASADETAKLWSLESKNHINLKGHKGRVLSVALSAIKKQLPLL